MRIDGKDDDTVYLYPFTRGQIRMIGIVQDYWRVEPSRQLDGSNRKETVGYYLHGPQQWDAREAVLQLTGTHHLYDTRRKAYLGEADRIAFPLQPGRPELFALLPYRVTGVNVQVPEQATAGEVLETSVEVTATRQPGDHVVHVELRDPTGKVSPSDTYNMHTQAGKGALRIPLALDALAGTWSLHARDAVTGAATDHAIEIRPSTIAPQDIFAQRQPEVIVRDAGWGAGDWVPYQPPTPPADQVQARVKSLRRHVANQGEYKGMFVVSGGFTLSNTLQSYELVYSACDDPRKTGTQDRSRISAYYPPGFGFNKPRPHLWYYNGYLLVKVDDDGLSHYAIRDIEQVEVGKNGRVDLAWETPRGSFRLKSVMVPDHEGLFQELEFIPSRPFQRIQVSFRSYPQGFAKPARAFHKVEQEHRSWVLLGDDIRDRAYGKGMGPGAMLILPDEWTTPNLDHTPAPVLVKELPEAAQPDAVRLHWTLWMFPDLANEKALVYMQEHAPSTRELLRNLARGAFRAGEAP